MCCPTLSSTPMRHRRWFRRPWRAWLRLWVGALALSALLWGTLSKVGGERPEPLGTRWLIGVDAAARISASTAWLSDQGLVVERAWPEFRVVQVRVDGLPEARARLWAALTADPRIRYVEPDHPIQAAQLPTPRPPDDPLYSGQWGLARIRAAEAWQWTTGNGRVVVALIDSGFDWEHEDLRGVSLWTNPVEAAGRPGVDDDGNGLVDDIRGWDYVEADPVPQDAYGHGTHVGGTLAALTDNGRGVAGVGRDLQVLPLRVLDASGSGFVSDLLDALAYALRARVHIVNLSLVLRLQSQALQDAVDQAYRAGILLVAATGNYGNRVYWPAAYTQTLAVAAVDRDDRQAIFSNAGPETDLAAPGVDILSTLPGSRYGTRDGTSMATPHVSGVAALVLSVRPDLAPISVTQILTATAADVNGETLPGRDGELGWGRLDAAAAVARAAAAVEMEVRLFPAHYIARGEPISVTVRLWVTDGQGVERPVVGGRVGYALFPNSGDPAPLHGDTGTTEATGQAHFRLTAPDRPGLYRLAVAFGTRTLTQTLAVQPAPLVLELAADTPEPQVGTAVQVQVQLRTADGTAYAEPLPIFLETDRGRWPGGQRTWEGTIEGSRLELPLEIGTRAGPATVWVQVENQREALELQVLPGKPARIQGPSILVGYGTQAPVYVPLALTVLDRFGNPVRGGRIRLYGPVLEAPMEVPVARDGIARAQIPVRSWTATPQPLWAVIPGTLSVHRMEVVVHPYRVWMPMVGR